MSWRGLVLALLAAAAATTGSAEVHAQRVSRPAKQPTLLSELGAGAAERLLASEAASDRLRGFARLSTLGTPRALELLGKALDPGGAARGVEEHLAAVRALAPHAKLPLAREALVRALSSPPVEADSGPLSDWVRASAALALARAQEPLALAALGRTLRKPGHAAELAKQALIANPPQDLAPLFHLPGAPSKELCEALGALGDRRAEGFLRDIVRRAAPEARAAAARALLRLGSTEVIELSRHWLRSERQPVLVAAATEILVQSGAVDAEGTLTELSRSPATRELALSLYLRSSGTIPAPAELTPALAAERSGALLELWSRGGAWAESRLEAALREQSTAGLALYALSRTPGEAARLRLERALSQPALRGLSLRSLALRHSRLGDAAVRASALVPTLLRSAQPAERAAAAFAGAVFTPESMAELLASRDPVVVRAVARLALSGAAARAAALRLTRERDPVLRAALSIALLDPAAAEQVPTPLLLELVHDASPGSLLAAAALSARKDADLLPLVRELLGSGDPWLRSHTLLGLSRARDPDVLGLIENAYRFEPDEGVRHAAVVALSRRREVVKLRTLRLAAELDAAQSVRAAARLALTGQSLGEVALGPDTAWLEIAQNPGALPGAAAAAQLRVGLGLALPLVADPDGVVALAGVDPAPLAVRLALLEDRVNVAGGRP
ncbi:MAG TPA: HEAT repeat domain-containing protein [Polyangiaceae bacterium]|nr:HEAT repeat domain-containing protein [Polyangiaceae bacterium]